jgi:hypothetical protein
VGNASRLLRLSAFTSDEAFAPPVEYITTGEATVQFSFVNTYRGHKQTVLLAALVDGAAALHVSGAGEDWSCHVERAIENPRRVVALATMCTGILAMIAISVSFAISADLIPAPSWVAETLKIFFTVIISVMMVATILVSYVPKQKSSKEFLARVRAGRT